MSQHVRDGMREIAIPDGPKCRRCGHEPCPFCETRCDTTITVNGETEFCCEECDFEPAALEAWLLEVGTLLGREYEPRKPPETDEERIARRQREEISHRMRFGSWIRNSDGKVLTSVDEVIETMRAEGSAFFKSGLAK